MIYASWSILVDITVALSLLPFIQFYAIPVAGITAGWFNALCLLRGLHQKQSLTILPSTYKVIGKVIICCLIMATFLLVFKSYVLGAMIPHNRFSRVIMIVFSMIVYFGACYLLAVFPRAGLRAYFRK